MTDFLTQLQASKPDSDLDDILLLDAKQSVKRPSMYVIMMMNDDYTPMGFVVEMLKTVFHLQHEDAMSTMLNIHHQGSAPCGVFTRDVAETKIDMVQMMAREHDYPLQCTMQEA